MRETKVFSSLQELELVFKRGLEIRFIKMRQGIYGICVNPTLVHMQSSNFNEEKFPTGETVLREQKITFAHELIHMYNDAIGSQPLKILGRFTEAQFQDKKRIEEETEAGALYIIDERQDFFEEIIIALSRHPICHISYRVKETPFYFYHRDIIYKLLLKLSQQKLDFNDSAHYRVLQYARAMDLTAYPLISGFFL